MTADTLILHGTGVSLMLELLAGAAPLWRYWGPRLPDGAVPGAPLGDGRPPASFSLDFDQPLTVFPAFGVGWFGKPALLAHRDGRDFAQAFTAVEVERTGPGSARIVMTDAVARLAVAVTLALDPASDVLTVTTALTNTGDAPLDVQWLASGCLPLPGDASSVRYFSGRHSHEFIACEDALGRGEWRRENRRGLTSHDAFPGAVVTMPCATRDTGVAFGSQLAWSGNHGQSIEWLDDGRFQWQMGVWLAPGEVRLVPGETLAAPAMLATCSAAGLNGVAQNFHAAIRARMVWPGGTMRPRPVHLNSWEALYFDHDQRGLTALADAAAAIGIERFVLDDGWFKGRTDDRRGLGDWTADALKYPDGLGPLAAHVTGLGMEFGLWVEPEMVNPDSDLFRAHPDWALQIAGRPLLTARHQLVLDMSRPEVGDHVFERLSALLTGLHITYLKWDHNRDLTAAAGPGGRARYRTQVLATYALLDRVRGAFPEVEIESCAGGGGRLDAGILTRTHRVWPSDCIDAVSRVAIQRGFLQFLPPEIMGAHVGASPAHSTGRSQSLGFRAGVALPGHFGVELDVRLLAADDTRALAGWIERYKAWRGRLHSGRVWLGDGGDGMVWQAHGDPHDLLLLVYQVEPASLRHAAPLRLAMLEAARTYRIDQLAVDARVSHAPPDAPLFVTMRAGSCTMAGAWLAAAGMPVPALRAESCAIFRITAA